MLPSKAGSYVLILHLAAPRTIGVGKLGEFVFPQGWYAYVGSARGPGGLAARVSRHQRKSKPRHWHIDYLRPHTHLLGIWYALGTPERECVWARELRQLPEASLPAPRFGASDCRCRAHLICFPASPTLQAFVCRVDCQVFETVLGDA